MTVLDKDGVMRLVNLSGDAAASPQQTEENQPDAAGLLLTVCALRASSDGQRIAVFLEIRDETRDLCECKTYYIDTALFSEFALEKGRISTRMLERIEEVAELSEAIRRGAAILSCGANSLKTLEQKLRARGFSSSTASHAALLLKEKGYLCEEDEMDAVTRRLLSKGWGERRILAELRCRGYGVVALERARAILCEEDFFSRCATAARKKSVARPAQAQDGRKLMAYLSRMGYGGEEIRYAMRNAWDDENTD